MLRPIRTAVVLATSLAVLAACGDEGITKADYVEQANAICKVATAAGKQVQSGLTGSSSREQIISMTRDEATIIQAQYAKIRDLGYPKGDEKTLKAIFSEAESALAKIKADPIKSLESGQDSLADVTKRLKAYGLTTCAAE
jgi:hypothetical protein